jgi:hypothetical protein
MLHKNAPQMAWKNGVAIALARSKMQLLHWRVKFFNGGIWEPFMLGDARK